MTETHELDTREARLDMIRVCFQAIVDGAVNPIAYAKAGLDFCDRTQAEREAMRGDA